MFNYSSNKFTNIEIFFLLSYFCVFFYPFVHSFFIPTSLSEVDNYVRFLLAIPVYILIREVKIDANKFILFINITAFEKSHLQNKSLEDPLKASWITFFSIPFYNIETVDAIQAISEMASRHMGYDWDSAKFIDYNDKKFDTTPDALEFIGFEEE